ncbi:MAG TPA: trehalose-phosphatase [Candidatus Melainabacteria bacterium]|nr:trehalose-phosphatase [Candidatus Melainabacteria bacterium]
MNLDSIAQKVRSAARKLLVFDRDGTIVPYADHPDDAIMDEDLKASLISLASTPGIDVAILSARGIGDLERDFSNGHPVILAGNYGLEMRMPDGSEFVEDRARACRGQLSKVYEELKVLEGEAYGGILENHGLSVCLHWHRVEPDKIEAFRRHVHAVAEGACGVALKSFPTSFEFFPDFSWDKGKGLELIYKKVATDDESCLVLFCGDTDSDEPAMDFANSMGGISIRVGYSDGDGAEHEGMRTRKIKKTLAVHRFESPVQVGELLSQILNPCS